MMLRFLYRLLAIRDVDILNPFRDIIMSPLVYNIADHLEAPSASIATLWETAWGS